MSDPTPRVQPFFCPYCGEQDLRPAATPGWHCRVCDRRFELSFLGVGPGGRPLAPPRSLHAPPAPPGSGEEAS